MNLKNRLDLEHSTGVASQTSLKFDLRQYWFTLKAVIVNGLLGLFITLSSEM